MYDKSLEQLIDAVIADGIITDQERKVVYKKAASLGIDQDEIEVYLEGRLDQHNSNQSPASNKEGKVHTCPNCGAVVPSFVSKCKECGFEFRDSAAVRSMRDFTLKLESAKTIEQRCEIIRTFPIPNNKEALMEFISVSESNSKDAVGILATRKAHWLTGCLVALSIFVLLVLCLKSEGEAFSEAIGLSFFGALIPGIICLLAIGKLGKPSKEARAWEIKLHTALNKVDVISKNDPELKVQSDKMVSGYRKKKNATATIFVGWFVLLVISFVVAISMPSTKVEEKAQLEKIMNVERQREEERNDSINLCINNGDYETADKLIKESYVDEQQYFEFLQKCVESMGAKGQINEAKGFINRKAVFFNDEYDSVDWRKNYKRGIVVEKLNTVIDSYK